MDGWIGWFSWLLCAMGGKVWIPGFEGMGYVYFILIFI